MHVTNRPLLEGLTEEQILEAAERWLCLLKADHLTWISHAGYEGDEYPVPNPDDRFLSLSMWTRFESPSPLMQCSIKTHVETEHYLTQFADKMRKIVTQEAREASVVLPSFDRTTFPAQEPVTA